jgi:hypothetical protein
MTLDILTNTEKIYYINCKIEVINILKLKNHKL